MCELAFVSSIRARHSRFRHLLLFSVLYLNHLAVSVEPQRLLATSRLAGV
jgi:hypothetical protein